MKRLEVLKSVGKLMAAALLTALVTVAMFSVLSGQSKQLADRVDSNAQLTRSGVAAIVCILNIHPELRTDEALNTCLQANGFADVPVLT